MLKHPIVGGVIGAAILMGIFSVVAMTSYSFVSFEQENVTLELYYVSGLKETNTYQLPVGTDFRILAHSGTYRLTGTHKIFNVFGIPGVMRYKVLDRTKLNIIKKGQL